MKLGLRLSWQCGNCTYVYSDTCINLFTKTLMELCLRQYKLSKHDFFSVEGSKSLFNRRPLTILDIELPRGTFV